MEVNTAKAFATDFQTIVDELEANSRSTRGKNRLEKFLRDHTGLPEVAVKFVASPKNFANRLWEILARPDQPRNVLIVVPWPLAADALRWTLGFFVDQSQIDFIAIATHEIGRAHV